jgi:hypothetical protein
MKKKMTLNEKVEFYKEKIRKNPEKGIIIPNDIYWEVTYGEKPDYSILDESFNDKGECL